MLAFALPVVAATTASLSPASINVVAGKSFTITVAVNPQGTANYAEKLEVDFPAANLQVASFTLGSNWMALTQSGYDSTDNTNGVLIKTAGYTSGITGPTTFGTITFTALKSGSGNITIGNSSLAFEIKNQTAITGTGTAFNVSANTVVPTTNTTVRTVTPTTVTQPTLQTTTVTTPTTQQAVNPAPNMQVAAVVVAGSSSYTWLLILLAVVALGFVGWWIAASRKSKTKL
jgi:cell division septation protein DedD